MKRLKLIILSAIFFSFIHGNVWSQHQLVSNFEVWFDMDLASSWGAYETDEHILLHYDHRAIPIIKATGEAGEIMTFCKAVYKIENELYALQYGGVYKLEEGSFQQVKSLSGNYNYSYQPLSAAGAGRGYFTSQEKELWQTDGTAEGTFKRLDLDTKPALLEVRSDSLHIITGGGSPVHYAYHLDTWGFTSHVMPSAPASQKIQDEFVLLSGGSDLVREIYNIQTRTVGYLNISEDGGFRWDNLKKINGVYFGANSDPLYTMGGYRRYSFSWINLDDLIVEKQVTTNPVYMRGFADVFSSVHGLVMFRNTGVDGCEVYSIDQDFNPTLLKDIYPGIGNGIRHPFFGSSYYIEHFFINDQAVGYNDNVYFAAISPTDGCELWRTNGSGEGTLRISNFLEKASGFSWIRPFVVEDKLYALADNGISLFLYAIDPDFEGYSDTSEEINEDTWSQFIFREGPSSEDYHSPLKDPVILETNNGLVGLIQGFREENANYNDKVLSMDGHIQDDVPGIPWHLNGNILYGMGENGNIEWHKWVIAHSDQCDLTRSQDGEDLFLVFSHKDSTSIGDYKIYQSGQATGLARLTSDGSVDWHQLFNIGKELRVHDVEATNENVFISGYYFSGALQIGNGVSASSPYGPQYFVAAFDYNGKGLWAVNTPMEGLSKYSTLGHLAIDGTDRKIYTATSEHTLTTWNSCEYGNWNGRLNALDMESGSLLWQTDFMCDDKFRIRDISVDSRGNLWVGGNFRGAFSYNNSEGLKAQGGSCPENTFLAIIHGYSGQLQQYVADSTIPKRFQRFLKREGIMEALYLTSESEHDDFMLPLPDRSIFSIEKTAFALSGNQIATESFPTGQGIIGFDSDDEIKFAACNIDENHFALKLFMGGGALGLGNTTAPPHRYSKAATTIIKRKHSYLGIPEFQVSELQVENGFKIYPNPLSGQSFTLAIEPSRVADFHTLSISDMTGRQVFQSPLSSRYSSAFYSIPNLSAGIYAVNIYGDDAIESQLLIVSD